MATATVVRPGAPVHAACEQLVKHAFKGCQRLTSLAQRQREHADAATQAGGERLRISHDVFIAYHDKAANPLSYEFAKWFANGVVDEDRIPEIVVEIHSVIFFLCIHSTMCSTICGVERSPASIVRSAWAYDGMRFS